MKTYLMYCHKCRQNTVQTFVEEAKVGKHPRAVFKCPCGVYSNVGITHKDYERLVCSK